jgi:surfactin synthase thioesterase subunit
VDNSEIIEDGSSCYSNFQEVTNSMSILDLQPPNNSKRRGQPTNERIKTAVNKFVDSFKRKNN